MASAQRPHPDREPQRRPEASRCDVPKGVEQPGQHWTPGWADKAELDSAARGTWPQREDGLRLPVAEDCAVALLQWPGPARQPGALGTPPLAWSDDGDAFWSTEQEARDGASSVSSGCLSGSLGGHVSCAPPYGPWKERPPRVPRPQRWWPRKSDPRLERLRDRIRQQARGSASCTSLSTSASSSASHLCSTSTLAAPRIRRVTAALPASAHPGVGIRVPETQGEDQASPGAGRVLSWATQHQAPAPQDKARRTRSQSCRRAKAPRSPSPSTAAKGKDLESVGVRAWRRGQQLARLLLGPPPARPSLWSTGPRRDLGPAMRLGDIKKAAAAEGSSAHTWPHRPTSATSDRQVSENTASLASHCQRASIQSAMATLGDLGCQMQAGLELAQGPGDGRKHRPSKLKPKNLGPQGPRSTRHRQGGFRKSSWIMTEGTRSTSDRPSLSHPQQPGRTSAEWQPCPQRACAARGWDLCFRRPPRPPEELSPSSQRPWSALTRQGCPQQAWVDGEDWEVPVPRPWRSLERPPPEPRRPWSGSFLDRAGPPCKAKGTTTPPSEAKQAWPGSSPGKGLEAQPCPPHLQPRGPLGRLHSSKALRDFMHQKAQVRRQQVLQQAVAAMDALERRSQQLQEVYRKQREAVQGQAVPVVSQTSPGIVTFVPSSTQSGVPKAPGSLELPELGWSKVTSGKVLGDQEVPGSFCLCLNRTWNHPETPLPVSATSLPGSLWLQDQARGLHVCLDPQAAERLGLSGPLQPRHKQARLQALETMADVLQQRVDILTAKLCGNGAPSNVPTAPACPGPLVPRGDRGSPHDDFLDVEVLPWNLESSPESQHQGAMQEGHWQLGQRLQRDSAPVQAPGVGTGSTLGAPAAPCPTCGSLRLEDLLTPWTPRSCCKGPQEPRGPHPRGRGGHPANFQLKSLSFLQSLKLDQRKQEQALALLRQRAEQEVWETQMALEGLLFKHQLQRLTEKHGAQTRPGMVSKPEQPQIHVGPEPTALAQRPMLARSRSPPALGREVTGSSRVPEEGQASVEGKSASAGLVALAPAPAQSPLARLSPRDSAGHQGSAGSTRSTKPGAGSVAAPKQSLREEELRAQHRAALLRLRRMALEEMARAELAWLEHLRGCLGSPGHRATGAAVWERTRQALSRLEKGRQSPSPRVKAAWEAPSETGPLEGAPTPRRPGSPASPRAQRGPENAEVICLASEHWEGTPETPSDADGHQQPPRLAWGEDTAKASSPPEDRGSPLAQESFIPRLDHRHSGLLDPGQLLDSASPALEAEGGAPKAQPGPQEAPEPPPGAPQTQPRACWPGKRPPTRMGGCARGSQGPGLGRPGADGPPVAREARVAEGSTCQAGLDGGGIPTEEPLEVESGPPGAQRTEACQQEDSSSPLAASPAAPAALEEEARMLVYLGSGPAAGLPLGSAGSPASSPMSSAGSACDLSCSSLQEFQKATATLVQLSDGSLSLSGPEAEGSRATEPSWSEELSAHEDFAPPLFWGLHQGDPQPGAVPGGAGPVTWQRPECGQAGALPGCPVEAAVADDLVPEQSSSQASCPLPAQDVRSPRSGSELSEASSQIWDEDIEENLSEPGPGAEPTSGSSSPPGLSSLEHSMAVPALGPRQGQEPSGTSRSLSGGSDTGSTEQASPEAASTSDLDLSLSFPSGTSASEGAGCQERPQAAGPSLCSERSPPQASSGPEVRCGLASPVAEGQAAGLTGNGDPRVPQQAGPLPNAGFLTEILSPVDEELSYGSGDLPHAPSWDAHLPPPPPIPRTDSDGDEAQPCSEDFPSPPQEAMVPQDSLGPLEEDTSITTEDVSLSEEAPRQALSLGPQQSGLCLGLPGPWGGPEGKLGGSGSAVGMRAVGGQRSEQVTWPESPLGEGAASVCGGLPRASAQPRPPSRAACVAAQDVTGLLVAGDPDVLGVGPWALKGASGSRLGPQEEVQCFESAGHQGGSESLSAAPQDVAAWVACGSPGRPGEEGVEGPRRWAEDSLGRELPREHVASSPASGSCSDLGTERDEVVTLVSTQLTQRILCDSMAVLAGLAPGGSL
ncbi:coiled-coil domain-containing protein 187 isoform X2 [Heterocephalus glaber]|uniref:Coiled-coil domain-containing protein 187 isoform X2 n=1 Tax=Heterocephalus glaber TaxID=10181 RepID=A0AAX6T702_HETGA|nr:coiled-coil domain-containing protein 187 isoform X2 [Heterocephalus glaber]